MEKTPKKTQVSVRGATYDRLRRRAKAEGLSIPKLVEQILAKDNPQ